VSRFYEQTALVTDTRKEKNHVCKKKKSEEAKTLKAEKRERRSTNLLRDRGSLPDPKQASVA